MVTIRCYAVVFSLSVFLVIQPSISIYCDEDDCYDRLGVSQNSNSSEIKKAYYKLSLKHHPDKNPDTESKKLFVKIANAYEILKDDGTRAQYDYAIAHPEEVFYNTARYYRAYYGHKTDPRAVLLLFWNGSWFCRYQVKQSPYTWEDASCLQRALGIPADAWSNIDPCTNWDIRWRRRLGLVRGRLLNVTLKSA